MTVLLRSYYLCVTMLLRQLSSDNISKTHLSNISVSVRLCFLLSQSVRLFEYEKQRQTLDVAALKGCKVYSQIRHVDRFWLKTKLFFFFFLSFLLFLMCMKSLLSLFVLHEQLFYCVVTYWQ